VRQEAPDPAELFDLVDKLTYRPGWTVHLSDKVRDTGKRGTPMTQGLTLTVVTNGYDSYHPERGEQYSVHHLFGVPAATYDRRSWQRWLFEQLLLVERHEACEFFVVDGERPYAPHHGPGNDPYIVFEYGTDEDVRTRFTGEVQDQ
jgi:hypothetical protein